MRVEPSSGESDDQTLVARMATDDGAAFAVLFRRYHGRVYRFARQMGIPRETAEDVTQETFVAFMETSDRFDPCRGTLGTYLYGIARNLLRRRVRKDASRSEVALGPLVEPTPDGAGLSDALADLEHAEAVASLRRAILSLPPRYREVIVLCDLHEVRYEEAATVIGCPVGTIRSRLSRARRILADQCRGDARARTPHAAGQPARRCMA